MIPIQNFAALIFNLVVCFGLPIALVIWFSVKNKQCSYAVIAGAATFCVSQLMLRVPLSSVAASWMGGMSDSAPWIYAIITALLAGIFEEGGKYAGLRLAMQHRQRWIDGVAFATGFAGLYNIFFSGITHISNFMAAMELEKTGMDQLIQTIGYDQANVYYQALAKTPWYQMALFGLHDIFLMAIQTALTLLLLYGIRKGIKQSVLFVLLAVGSHLLIEGVIVALTSVFSASDYLTEAYLAALAIASVWFIFWSKNKNMFAEKQTVPKNPPRVPNSLRG